MPVTVSWFVEPAVSILARANAEAEPVRLSINGIATRSSDEQFETLVSGALDVAVTAMDNVMDWNLRPGGGDFRIVAQVEQTTPISLVARAAFPDLESFRGGTLLVDAPDNGLIVAIRALLDECGMPAGSYALKPAGGGRERYDALLGEEGDATLLGPPFDGMAVARGCRILARINARYPAFPGQGLVVRQSAYDRIRAPLSAWLAQLERARAVARADTEGAALRLAEAGIPGPAAQVMAGFVPETFVPDSDGIALLIAQRQRAGLRGGDVAYADLVDPVFLDDLTAALEPRR